MVLYVPRSGIEDSREFQSSQIPGKSFGFLLSSLYCLQRGAFRRRTGVRQAFVFRGELGSSSVHNAVLLYDLVDLFSMNDTEDQYIFTLYAEDDAVVSHAEFPVSFQCSSEGFTVFLWRREESCFYGVFNSDSGSFVKLWDIFRFDRWMVLERVAHVNPRRLRG